MERFQIEFWFRIRNEFAAVIRGNIDKLRIGSTLRDLNDNNIVIKSIGICEGSHRDGWIPVLVNGDADTSVTEVFL